MSIEIAATPGQGANRAPLWAWAARLVLPATILVSLLFELALAERKYALFGGGFGQSRALDAPLEIGAFLVALLACQSLVFWLLYRGLRRLHGRRGGGPLFLLNFAILVGGGAIGATIAKYEALSYFSDAMSLQIVRNLGGGSLTDALLFSLSEVGLALIVVAGVAFVYAALLFVARRRWRDAPALPDPYRLSGRQIAVFLVAVPLLLFAAGRIDDTRSALARFNTVSLIGGAMDQLTDFDRDGWSLYSFPIDGQPFDGSRHPYALDIPNDGVDEDGLGGDFTFAEPVAPSPTPVIAANRRRNVVLIVLESTRADAIGMRVDGRPVAPTLEAMARAGSIAPAAYSHVGFTTQSLQSLFSGQLAPADDRTSLVRDFLANGYQVGVFSGQAEDFGDTANAHRDAARLDLHRRHHQSRGARLRFRRAGLTAHRRPACCCASSTRGSGGARPGRNRISSISTCRARISLIPIRACPAPCRASRSRAARSTPPIASGWRAPIGMRSPITTG